jgi:hypothetical protein
VACVPWQNGLPHETWNGNAAILKAVIKSDAFPVNYTWSFGDGTPNQTGTVNNQSDAYKIEASHFYPNSAAGTPYTATLTATDAGGGTAVDTYRIVVQDKSLSVQTDVSIDTGLWYLQKTMARSDAGGVPIGSWSEAGYSITLTGCAVLSFENEGFLASLDPARDPYAETVQRGLNDLCTQMTVQSISGPNAQCPYGNPDTNGNGLGISVASDYPPYEIGPAMMAIAASGQPNQVAVAGPANVIGRTYKDILTDMVDLCAWGQTDSGRGRGGWRYDWNYSDSDNSVVQWPVLGMEAAQTNWGIQAPDFVKRELYTWLVTSQNSDGCWGYTDTSNEDFAHIGTGLVGLTFCGPYANDAAARIQGALNWLDTNWGNTVSWGGNTLLSDKYSVYAVMKGLRTTVPPITAVGNHDWFTEFATSLVSTQQPDGSWPYTSRWTEGPMEDTVFSILTLEPTVAVAPPVVVMKVTPLQAQPGATFTFDASGSYHLDPARKIASYHFDFGDGTSYTETPGNAPDGTFDGKTTHVYAVTTADLQALPGQKKDYTVTMTVTDDNPTSPKTAAATELVTISLQNHPPVSDPGGPYVGSAGVPVTISGIGSYDPDSGPPLYNHITKYEWQLTDVAPYTFSDASTLSTTWTWNAVGTYNIGLRVTDGYGATTTTWTTVMITSGTPTKLWMNPEEEGEYSDSLDLVSRLTTTDGVPVPGMTIAFYVDQNGDGTASDNEAVGTAPTDAQGFARLAENLPLPPGRHAWRAAFAGSDPYIVSEGLGYLSLEKEATQLAYKGDTSGHDGAVTTLRAVLTDTEGNSVAGQAITLKIGNQSVPATTGPDGVALVGLVLNQPVGAYDVQYAFAGTENYDPSSGSTPFVILNTAPKVTEAAAATTGQHGVMALTAGFAHADPGQTVQAWIDWGDGTKQPVSATQEGGAGYYAVSASHAYAADGIYTAMITMADGAGGTAGTQAQLAVQSIPPTATLERFGVHAEPTKLVLRFNEPLDAASASNVANYRLVRTGPHGKVLAESRPIRLAAAVYDEMTRTVTLLPRLRLPLRNNYRLIVNGGTSAGGVRDRASVLLDGNHDGKAGDPMNVHFDGRILAGSAATWPIGWRTLKITPPASRTTTHAAAAVAPQAAAVDALLADGSLAPGDRPSNGPATDVSVRSFRPVHRHSHSS